jgi:hypothetical protein
LIGGVGFVDGALWPFDGLPRARRAHPGGIAVKRGKLARRVALPRTREERGKETAGEGSK